VISPRFARNAVAKDYFNPETHLNLANPHIA